MFWQTIIGNFCPFCSYCCRFNNFCRTNCWMTLKVENFVISLPYLLILMCCFLLNQLLIFIEKFLPLPGFEPRTSQVPSQCATIWAIQAWIIKIFYNISVSSTLVRANQSANTLFCSVKIQDWPWARASPATRILESSKYRMFTFLMASHAIGRKIWIPDRLKDVLASGIQIPFQSSTFWWLKVLQVAVS